MLNSGENASDKYVEVNEDKLQSWATFLERYEKWFDLRFHSVQYKNVSNWNSENEAPHCKKVEVGQWAILTQDD